MDKEDSPFTIYIEEYCMKCKMFNTDKNTINSASDLSSGQFNRMKKHISECAVVRMAINTESQKVTMGNIYTEPKLPTIAH